MKKNSTIFLIVNFFICIILWMLFVKLTYAFGIELYRYHTLPEIIYFLTTLIIDLNILAAIGLLKKELVVATVIEVFIFYLIIWVMVEVTSYH
jgi:hypothetical protein